MTTSELRHIIRVCGPSFRDSDIPPAWRNQDEDEPEEEEKEEKTLGPEEAEEEI